MRLITAALLALIFGMHAYANSPCVATAEDPFGDLRPDCPAPALSKTTLALEKIRLGQSPKAVQAIIGSKPDAITDANFITAWQFDLLDERLSQPRKVNYTFVFRSNKLIEFNTTASLKARLKRANSIEAAQDAPETQNEAAQLQLENARAQQELIRQQRMQLGMQQLNAVAAQAALPYNGNQFLINRDNQAREQQEEMNRASAQMRMNAPTNTDCTRDQWGIHCTTR